MIKKNDIIKLKIEKLTYQGTAIGRYYSEQTPKGFTVFVKNAAPDDLLNIKIIKVNKSYAIGEILEIIEPSNDRVKPFCPLFNACGGCCYQYLKYDCLLEQKNQMLKEAFMKLKEQPIFLEPIKSPQDKEFRHKIQYRVSETKKSKRLLIGYFKEKSHDIVNIKFCPIQPSLTDEIVQYIRENWTFGAYLEKAHKGFLRSLIFRFSLDLTNVLVTFVLNLKKNDFFLHQANINTFFMKIAERFPQIRGIIVNFNPEKTNKIITDDFICVYGNDFIYENLKDGNFKRVYKISPASFFQVNPNCAIQLFNEVKKNIKENSIVLDAYGGVGAIGIWVSDKARKIYLVEENSQAVADAKENFKINGCKNYEVFLGDAKNQFRIFLKEKKKFNHVIIDPPRKGSDHEALELLSNLTNSIIYVSCNPQTLVRDIKILEKFGFKVKTLRGVDMFPYSYHIESVAVIERE